MVAGTVFAVETFTGDRFTLSPQEMEDIYNNKDSQYYKQNIEPYVELSKKMASAYSEIK